MQLNFKRYILIIGISAGFSFSLSAQNPVKDNIQAHILRYQSDSILTEESLRQIQDISSWVENNPEIPAEYALLLNKYLTFLSQSSYKKHNAATHEDIISQALNILKAASDPNTNMVSWTYSLLPEYYAAVKTLIPAEVAKRATLDMTKERPQELIGQYSRLFYADDAEDLQNAILSSPHLFSQFMHYNNLVKAELQKSANPDIKILFDIYQKYRYSQHPYFLLPYISKKEMTIEKAEEYSKNEVTLISYLLPLVIDSTKLAATSVDQRWDELSSKYVKKIKQYKYRQLSTWEMESFDQIPTETLAKILFVTNSMLNPQDLTAFIRWIKFKNKDIELPVSYLDKISLKDIYQLNERIVHDQLDTVWASLWGKQAYDAYLLKRKKDANPIELNQIEKNLKGEFAAVRPTLHQIPVTPKPIVPEFVIKKYFFNLPENEKILIKWKNDPVTAMENITTWIDAPYSKELLMYISEVHPLEIVKNLDKIKLKKQGIEALKNLGKVAPLSTKNYIIQPTHPWNHLFKSSQDSVIRLLYKINEVAGINSRAYLLIDDIYHQKITIAEADSLCKDSQRLTKRMIELLAKPDVMGKYSIEQEISARSLKFVRHLNISENTDNYFAGKLQELTSEEIYTFMTYGEDEIIQRGFYKMLRLLISKTPQGNIYPLMQSLGFNNYKKFLRKCAYYDLLDTVFKSFTNSQKNQIINKLLANIENSTEDDAIQVADIIISLNSPEITELLHQQLKKEYERAEANKIDKGVAIYGILSSLISRKIDGGWAKYVAEKYELPGLDLLPAYSLFNQQMVNVQQYYFYNDEDGVGSYNNFIKSYERSPLEWTIKDLGSFVMIQSKTGRKIELYANKARDGETGITAMLDYMKKNSLEPQVVVHRGLSTHTLKTFTRIPSSAKLILDGSCGGYHVQQIAIDRAPGAQILCNRNVGTMHINDPLFKQINDEIRAGKDIIWSDFWSKMDQRVGTNPYFKDYIPPHKNAAAILIKALYDILEIN